MFIVYSFVMHQQNIWRIKFFFLWKILMKKTFKVFYVVVSFNHVNYLKCGNLQNSREKFESPQKKSPQFFSLKRSDTKFFLWDYDLSFQVVKTLSLWASQCLKNLKFLSWGFLIKCCYNLKTKTGNKKLRMLKSFVIDVSLYYCSAKNKLVT